MFSGMKRFKKIPRVGIKVAVVGAYSAALLKHFYKIAQQNSSRLNPQSGDPEDDFLNASNNCAKDEFENTQSGMQIFSYDITHSDSIYTPHSKFRDEPNGPFKGQEKSWRKWGIKQLARDQTIHVFRGDPRPLGNGYSPKNKAGSTQVKSHRLNNSDSCANSTSFNIRVALSAGADAAQKPYYGNTLTLGENRFFLCLFTLPGNKYSVAGPAKELLAHEEEATVVGVLYKSALWGYRECQFFPRTKEIVCESIYLRRNIPQREQDKTFNLLSHQKSA